MTAAACRTAECTRRGPRPSAERGERGEAGERECGGAGVCGCGRASAYSVVVMSMR